MSKTKTKVAKDAEEIGTSKELYNFLYEACNKIKDNEVFEKAYKYVEMYYTPGTNSPAPESKEQLSDSVPMAAEEREEPK